MNSVLVHPSESLFDVEFEMKTKKNLKKLVSVIQQVESKTKPVATKQRSTCRVHGIYCW